MYNKAKESLKNFMEAWKIKNWQIMYKHTTLTWQRNHPEYVTELPPCQQLLDGIVIRDYKIGKAHKSKDFSRVFQIPEDLNICIDIGIEIDWTAKGNSLSGTKVGDVRMLCEKDAYNLSQEGQWGVNILSLLKMKEKE